MAAKYALGIDFGGTKVLAAVVDLKDGKVVASAKKKTSASDGLDEVMERIFDVADNALDKAKLKPSQLAGIGVGIAGQVDAERGILLGTPNLSQAVVDLPIAKRLRDRYDVSAALRNDVQIAAAGEQRFGAGKGVNDFLCVFVGTGVGGALVQDGVLQHGAAGSAGEIGHVVVDAGGRLCGCGGHGHLEAYASRTAITASILGDLKRGRPSIVRELVPDLDPGAPAAGGTAIRSGVLAKGVEAGDAVVVETLHEAGYYLGLGLASAINLINPQRIVLGGGVIEAVDALFQVAASHARREALPTPAASVEIVKAGLGDYSGVVGAALIAAGGD
jgi:glucokinase